MNSGKNRADKILIAIALVILLLAAGMFYFDSWMWGNRGDRGERIGLIAAKSGDVRMKFEGDLKWKTAANGQDLIYNDAIYAGSGSQAKLKVGESELTVNENTLIVLRRDKNVNFLNLNYGTLVSKIAKNEKIMIDTGNGKPIELTTKQNTQIVLRKVNGKTELNVVSGEADMVVDGKKSKINSASRVVVEPPKTANVPPPLPKVEPLKLRATAPLQGQVITSEKPASIGFTWVYEPPRQIRPEDNFTLEFSGEPSFKKIHARKEVKGALTTSMNATQSLSLYYRVRGPKGELSQTERVQFVRLDKPLIVTPIVNQQYMTPPGQNAVVPVEFKKPANATTWYQISSDPDFNEVAINQNVQEARVPAELAIGNYFIRAKSDFGQGRTSEWTDAVPFKVAPQLAKMQLAQVPDRNRVLIPNRAYPASLYKAGNPRVRSFLAQKGFLSDFFPFKKGSFDQLKIETKGQKEIIQQTSTAWPEQNLAPGRYSFRYQVSKLGTEPQPPSNPKELTIAMEPPRAIGEAQYGNPDKSGARETLWSFTPLLFARSYDIELSRDPSFPNGERMKSTQTTVKQKLLPGEHYWRARARDSKGRVISDFSETKRIVIPDLAPAIANGAKPEDRKPAATQKSVTRIEKEKVLKHQPNGWWAWAGTGANFVDYRQSVPGRGTINSQNFKGPSQYLEAGFNGKNGWGGVFTYKNTPGEMLVENAAIDNGAYSWSTISMEGILRKASPFTIFKAPLVYGMRLGVQQHKTPFVFLDSNTDLQMKSNEMNTGSLGVLAELSRKRWTYYWLMRYQFPFSSKASGSDQFTVKPTFAFDGSIGASYNITDQLKLGTFWYGQWHQYNFVYADSSVTNDGFQSLFYSNIDVRLGFDF